MPRVQIGSSPVFPLQVSCYDQDVVTEMEADPKELGAEHHATQTLTFADSIGEVKDEQPPGWSTATADMKFEYLLYGHRDQLACQVCGKSFLDESRLRYVLSNTTHVTRAVDTPGGHTCVLFLQETREAAFGRASVRL